MKRKKFDIPEITDEVIDISTLEKVNVRNIWAMIKERDMKPFIYEKNGEVYVTCSLATFLNSWMTSKRSAEEVEESPFDMVNGRRRKGIKTGTIRGKYKKRNSVIEEPKTKVSFEEAQDNLKKKDYY